MADSVKIQIVVNGEPVVEHEVTKGGSFIYRVESIPEGIAHTASTFVVVAKLGEPDQEAKHISLIKPTVVVPA